MTTILTRRRLLASASLVAASAVALRGARALASPPVRLTAERRTLDIDGRAASVFGLSQPDGTPGLVLGPDQGFLVDLVNLTREPTIVHWHGQTPPVRQDGVTMTGLETPIEPGAGRSYDFAPRPGTHWMHSHLGLQEQLLMAAPLVVRTAEETRADVQEVVVMLHDFTFRDPEEVLAGLTASAGMAGTTSADQVHPMSGMAADHDAMPGMAMDGPAMPGMDMSGHGAGPVATPSGPGTARSGMSMDLNDIDFDAYLANDRTLADPLVVRTGRAGRIRLRLINAATSTAFWLDLGSLPGQVVAVDGDPVEPLAVRRFPISQGQRVDLVLEMPRDGGAFPVLAEREGDRQRTGIVLATPGARIAKVPPLADARAGAVDLSLERRLRAARPLPPRPADVVHRVDLTGTMMPYRWSLDGRSWADHMPIAVSKGQRVELELVNRSRMAHPMHLHGHHFQIVALNGKTVAGAMRDTVLVPVNGRVRVAFDADTPGRWLFHCHNLYHMAAGMMTEVAYAGFA